MRSVTRALALLLAVPLLGSCQPSHKKMSTVVEEREVPLPADLAAAAGNVRADLAAEAAAVPSTAGAQAEATAPTPTPAPAVAPAAEAAPAAAAGPSPAVLADARHFYANRCAMCHGARGLGDGVAAQNLRPQPRSFAEASWQGSARDEDIAMVIVRGGRAIGRSMMMPASTDLADKPEMVRALVAVVRGFGAPQGAANQPTP